MPIYKNTGNYLVLPTHVGIEIILLIIMQFKLVLPTHVGIENIRDTLFYLHM